MTSLIRKRRSRKPLAEGPVTIGIHFSAERKRYEYVISVGEYELLLSQLEAERFVKKMPELFKETHA